MNAIKKYLDKVIEKIDSGEKVLVNVGDFGEEKNALGESNRIIVIHTLYISKDKPISHQMNFLFNNKQEVDDLTFQLKQATSAYFEEKMAPADLQKFKNLFDF